MITPTRTNAQHRSDAVRTFRRELARLRVEGALSLPPEQQQAVDRGSRRRTMNLVTPLWTRT